MSGEEAVNELYVKMLELMGFAVLSCYFLGYHPFWVLLPMLIGIFVELSWFARGYEKGWKNILVTILKVTMFFPGFLLLLFIAWGLLLLIAWFFLGPLSGLLQPGFLRQSIFVTLYLVDISSALFGAGLLILRGWTKDWSRMRSVWILRVVAVVFFLEFPLAVLVARYLFSLPLLLLGLISHSTLLTAVLLTNRGLTKAA